MKTSRAPHWGLTVFLCALAALLDGYDLQILALATPSVAADLGLRPSALAPALAATLGGAAIGAMGLAPLADRFGRRIILVAALIVMGAPTLAVGFVHSVPEIAMLRFLAGLGFGAAVPVATTFAADQSPAARRGLMVSIVVVSAALGALAASLAAPILEGIGGWRCLFIFGAIPPLVLAPIYWALLPGRDPALDAHTTWNSPAPLYRNGLRLPTGLLWLIWGLSLATTAAISSWLPTLLVALGEPRASAQHAVGLLALGGIAGGLALGWLADRVAAPPVVAAGYGLGAVAVVVCLAIAPPAARPLLFLAIGLGAWGGQTVLAVATARAYPDFLRSTGVGWATGVGRVVSIGGPLIGGALIAQGLAPPLVLACAALPLLICAIASIALSRSDRV